MNASVGNDSSMLSRMSRSQYGPLTAKVARSKESAGVNVGSLERQVSLLAGVAAALIGVSRRDVPGLLLAAVGAGLVYRGASGHCGVYNALGIDSLTEDDANEQTQ